MILDLEATFTVGEENFFESTSPQSSFGVTFEDDQETGYFYAVNTKPDLVIMDALHIYNVEEVTNKSKPCTIQVGWSNDGTIAVLLINGYCHAVFDFEKKEGSSRNGFPEAGDGWNIKGNRILDIEMVNELFKTR